MGGPAGNPGGLGSVDPSLPNVPLPSSTMSLPPMSKPVAVSWDRYEGTVTRRAKFNRVGHEPHFIQVRLSGERPMAEGKVRAVSDDGWIDVARPDGDQRLWTHDPGRVRALVDLNGPWCDVRSSGILGFPELLDDGTVVATSMVSVSKESTPCTAAATVPPRSSSARPA